MTLENALNRTVERKREKIQHEAVRPTEIGTAVSGIMNDVTTFAAARDLRQVSVNSPKPRFLHVTNGPVTFGILVHGADKFDASAPNSSVRIGITREELDDMLIAFILPHVVYRRDVEAHGPAIGRQHPHFSLRA
jgi:hypothetical protein